MLELTQNATAVIGELVDRSELPEGSGLRIVTTDDGPDEVRIAAAESPEPGDQIVETDEVRVFIEAAAATALEDMALDAEIDDRGRVQFLFVAQ